MVLVMLLAKLSPLMVVYRRHYIFNSIDINSENNKARAGRMSDFYWVDEI